MGGSKVSWGPLYPPIGYHSNGVLEEWLNECGLLVWSAQVGHLLHTVFRYGGDEDLLMAVYHDSETLVIWHLVTECPPVNPPALSAVTAFVRNGSGGPCAAHRLSEKNVLQNAKNHPLILQNSNFTNGADGLLPICKIFLSQSVLHLTQLCSTLQASVNSHE